MLSCFRVCQGTRFFQSTISRVSASGAILGSLSTLISLDVSRYNCFLAPSEVTWKQPPEGNFCLKNQRNINISEIQHLRGRACDFCGRPRDLEKRSVFRHLAFSQYRRRFRFLPVCLVSSRYVQSFDAYSKLFFLCTAAVLQKSQFFIENMCISCCRRFFFLRGRLWESSPGSREAYFSKKMLCYANLKLLATSSGDSRNIVFSGDVPLEPLRLLFKNVRISNGKINDFRIVDFSNSKHIGDFSNFVILGSSQLKTSKIVDPNDLRFARHSRGSSYFRLFLFTYFDYFRR